MVKREVDMMSAEISDIKELCPELRIGQIMVSAAKLGGWKPDDIFYCPDEVLHLGFSKLLTAIYEEREGRK